MLYPNPTNGKLIVETNSHFVNGQIELFDAASLALYTSPIYQPVFEVDMSTLPSGMYWLKLTSPQGKNKYEKVLKV
ncbi:MAG: T9SS type A sorting domain-containing protein [Bacteroidota bacterium]